MSLEDEAENNNLYVKIKCSVCLGGSRAVFSKCLYCDEERNQIIEASTKEIKRILKMRMSKDEKKQFISDFLEE